MGNHMCTRSERRLRQLERELHRARAERDAALAQLSESRQQGTLALLASSVAHEVNNPLQGIMAYAQLLEDVLPDETKERAYAVNIVRACQHMRGILGEVLQFARGTHDAPERIEPVQLIRRAYALMEPSLKQDAIILRLEVDPQVPRILGCARQLLQVLTNLIANARDAMLDQPTAQPRTLTLRLRRVPEHLRIEVEDTGPGIPETRLPYIFEAFYSSKGPGKGTGLGLAISRSIVERHAGRIEAENLTPHGARIALELPLAPRDRRRSGERYVPSAQRADDPVCLEPQG